MTTRTLACGIAFAMLLSTQPKAEVAQFRISPPPAAFAGPYAGTLKILHGDARTVRYQCYGGYACAWMGKLKDGYCEIWMPHVGTVYPQLKVTQAVYDEMMRHELGHCNGWPRSHPHH